MVNVKTRDSARKFVFRGEAGHWPVLDRMAHQVPYEGPFFYDVYSWHESMAGAVQGESWYNVIRLGGCNALEKNTYMTTRGFRYEARETLLLLNAVPPGMFFYQADLTFDRVQCASQSAEHWWWPAWLKGGLMGFAFADETDMMVIAGLDLAEGRP